MEPSEVRVEGGEAEELLNPTETSPAQVEYMEKKIGGGGAPRGEAGLRYCSNVTAECFRGCFTSLTVKKLKH